MQKSKSQRREIPSKKVIYDRDNDVYYVGYESYWRKLGEKLEEWIETALGIFLALLIAWLFYLWFFN